MGSRARSPHPSSPSSIDRVPPAVRTRSSIPIKPVPWLPTSRSALPPSSRTSTTTSAGVQRRRTVTSTGGSRWRSALVMPSCTVRTAATSALRLSGRRSPTSANVTAWSGLAAEATRSGRASSEIGTSLGRESARGATVAGPKVASIARRPWWASRPASAMSPSSRRVAGSAVVTAAASIRATMTVTVWAITSCRSRRMLARSSATAAASRSLSARRSASCLRRTSRAASHTPPTTSISSPPSTRRGHPGVSEGGRAHATSSVRTIPRVATANATTEDLTETRLVSRHNVRGKHTAEGSMFGDHPREGVITRTSIASAPIAYPTHGRRWATTAPTWSRPAAPAAARICHRSAPRCRTPARMITVRRARTTCATTVVAGHVLRRWEAVTVVAFRWARGGEPCLARRATG